jgi:ABC-type glycerol-3-phosphate transport system substrate-binding protein
MKMSKMLLVLSVMALLLNACGKISNLLTSDSAKTSTTTTPDSNKETKEKQGFWSKWFGSSTPKNDKTDTPASSPAQNQKL